jgi:hypothetical protein
MLLFRRKDRTGAPLLRRYPTVEDFHADSHELRSQGWYLVSSWVTADGTTGAVWTRSRRYRIDLHR